MPIEKYMLSWQDIEKCVQQLADNIRESRFTPDILVGITRGGLIPLALLSEELDITNIITFSATSYSGTRRGELLITYRPAVDLRGKKVLLIDEIADSGTTLFAIAHELKEKYYVSELKTAVLAINQQHCIQHPDYFCIEDTRWIVFPWEKDLDS